MITGVVTGRPEVVFPIPIRDSAGLDHMMDVVLDTGYTGYLTLPPLLVATLGLPLVSQQSVILADGASVQVGVDQAVVVWNGAPRQVPVQEVDTAPLIGMKLLLGHDLRVRVVPGGAAEIEAVP